MFAFCIQTQQLHHPALLCKSLTWTWSVWRVGEGWLRENITVIRVGDLRIIEASNISHVKGGMVSLIRAQMFLSRWTVIYVSKILCHKASSVCRICYLKNPNTTCQSLRPWICALIKLWRSHQTMICLTSLKSSLRETLEISNIQSHHGCWVIWCLSLLMV